jgi:hypothetical protein
VCVCAVISGGLSVRASSSPVLLDRRFGLPVIT